MENFGENCALQVNRCMGVGTFVIRISTVQRWHWNDDRTQAELLLDRLLGRHYASHDNG